MDIKANKGAKTAKGKAHLAALEAELVLLRDQQKKERPLPARLQAATYRLEKLKASQAEQIAKLDAAKEEAVSLEEGLAEINTKLAEAEAEMAAVRRQAAEGEAASAFTCMQQVLLASMSQERRASRSGRMRRRRLCRPSCCSQRAR